jgi:tetratricopeptide (TPR) repeat protein
MAVTQKLEGDLPNPCPPETPLVLSVEYECGSEENRRWLNLTSDFSFSSYYASAWIPTFGYRRGTGTFRYSVPKEMVVAATGRKTTVEPKDERVVYTFDAVRPSVFDFVAGPFTVQRREGRVPVSVYHLDPLVRAEEIMARAARIIGVLEEEFGPYPFDELAIVEAPMGPAVYAGIEGGAYPGYFMVRSDLLHADGLEDWVVGHELTHFWFPHVVGHADEPVAPAMLDEALAHYGALRVVEALAGPAAGERFRRDGGKEAIRLTAAGLEHSLAGMKTTERWDRVAYNFSNTKAHLVYDMLARTIGRERFQSALQRVIREQAGQDIAWSDFWQSIEADAGEPVEWFYAQWLDRPSLPTLWLEWSQVGSRLKLVVRQSAFAFRLEVPLQVEFSDGTAVIDSATIEGERTEVDITTDKLVHTVRLDPHYTILHATPEQWAEAEARRFVTKGTLLREDEDLDQALDMFREGLEQVDEVDVWGVEFLLRLHIGWLHQEEERFDEALAEYERALACAIRPADHLARLYLNLATIAKDRGDPERGVWAAKNAVTVERSLGNHTEVSREARQLLEGRGQSITRWI